jgi:2-polyprenyl-3-methyl-5-hydroxy-6-metoxy-1,4-benzoquinol methylase
MDEMFHSLIEDLFPVWDKAEIKQVCDYGCGRGELLQTIHELRPDWQLTGIDLPAALLETGSVAAAMVDREGPDFTTLLNSAKFDLIVSTFAIHHFEYPVRELHNLCGMLKPGGQIVIIDHRVDLESEGGCGKSVESLVGEFFASLNKGYHRHHYTLAEALDLISFLPIDVIESKEFRRFQSEENTRETGNAHIERNAEIQKMVREKASEVKQLILLPLLEMEANALKRCGLDNSGLFRIIAQKQV